MSAEETTTTANNNNTPTESVDTSNANNVGTSNFEKSLIDDGQKKDIDRLTQLQMLIDQLLEQFLLSLTYLNNKHKLNNDQEQDTFNEEEFKQNIEELSNDLIIKCKQILKLVDLLPDSIDSKEESLQIEKIKSLSAELEDIEQQKLEKLEEKDNLLKKIGSIIKDFNKL
ncbi:hypothetical protein ACO0SA_000294 [Hanseniaspora valbyensis]